jgi:uncharacterized protein YdcH (DUF465 family)
VLIYIELVDQYQGGMPIPLAIVNLKASDSRNNITRSKPMQGQKHDLHHEFPEFNGAIHELKMTDNHFARLFNEYHELDHEVHRIETGVENTSDDYLEERKKARLNLKDQLFGILKAHAA